MGHARKLRGFGPSLGLALLAALGGAPPALAQAPLTAVVIRGRAAAPGLAAGGAGTILAAGLRIESPPGSWTEIAFSDGTSVVLDPGADFTLQGYADLAGGRLAINAVAARGRLRLSTSDQVEIRLRMPAGEVRLPAGSAVVEVAPDGTATLISGRELAVRCAGGGEETIRRPGFAVPFARCGTQRRTEEDLARTIAVFAPGRTEASNLSITAPGAGGPGLGGPGGPRGPETPSGPNGGGSRFQLAELALGGVGVPATSVSSPGPTTGNSPLNAGSATFTPESQEREARILGQPAFDRFTAPGRVRRFAAEASGAQARREDSGVVTVNGTRGVASRFFERATDRPAGGQPGAAMQAQDLVANVGVITVQRGIFREPADPVSGREENLDLLTQPRLTVFDSATPRRLISQDPAIDRQTYSYTAGAILETGLQDLRLPITGSVPPDTTLSLGRAPTDGTVSRLAPGNGLVMLSLPPGGPAYETIFRARRDFGEVLSTASVLDPGREAQIGSVAPGIFIVDKLVDGSEEYFRGRVPAGERFFVIGGTPAPVPAAGLPSLPPGEVTRFAISDGLNPVNADARGGFRSGRTIAAQFQGPGAPGQPTAFNRFNAFRPDETFANRPEPPAASPSSRGDTHLLAIAGAAGQPSPAYRADLEVTADGRSSGSVSVAGIAPQGPALVLSGRTVGSARLDTARASRGIAGNLGSLGTDASGTGAHMLPSAAQREDIGHFALGQSDQRRGLPGTPEGEQPGSVTPVSGGAGTPYGFTRLATNVGRPPGLPVENGAASLQGFAAGIVESVSGAGVALHGVSTAGLGGVSVERAAGSPEFAARIALRPTEPGALASDPGAPPAATGARGEAVMVFGGRDPTSGMPNTAYIGSGHFAALGEGQAMAAVGPELLRGIANGAALPPGNEHLSWGLNLGELTVEAGAARRDHLGLGFWVAGRPVAADTLATLRGSASYSGGMIGTVAQPGSLRTVAGDFTKTWNFSARSGEMTANFDGQRYAVGAAMARGGNVFTGGGAAGGRSIAVQGAFFQAGAVPPGGAPAAVGGAFGIRGADYGANGVFAGGRRP